MEENKSYIKVFTIAVACFGCCLYGQLFAQTSLAKEKRYTVVVVEVQAARVGFYNSQTGAKIGSVAVGSKPHEMEISRDGKTAYVTNFGIEDYDHRIGTAGNSISVIDISQMKEKYKLLTENLSPKDSAFASVKGPHGIKLRPSKEDELFVNTEVGGDFMMVYDVKKRKLKRSFSVPAGTHNFIFSPEGQYLYLFAGANGVFKVNPETGDILAEIKLSTPVRGLHYTTDNRFIIAAASGEAALLNPENLSIERHFKGLEVGPLLYPKPTPDGRYILFPAVYDAQIVVLEIKSGKIAHRLKVGKNPISVVVSPDGNTCYISSHTDNYFCSVDLKTFEFKKFAEAGGSNGIGIGNRIK